MNAALIVIDMQRDFCSPGGYADAAGMDVQRLREPAGVIRSLQLQGVGRQGLDRCANACRAAAACQRHGTQGRRQGKQAPHRCRVK